MRQAIFFTANELESLYTKLIRLDSDVNRVTDSPIFLLNNQGKYTIQHEILATELKLGKPLMLQHFPNGIDHSSTGLFIVLLEGNSPIHYRFGEQPAVRATQSLFIMRDNAYFSLKADAFYQGWWTMIHVDGNWCNHHLPLDTLSLPSAGPMSGQLKTLYTEFWQNSQIVSPLGAIHQSALLNQLFLQVLTQQSQKRRYLTTDLTVAQIKAYLTDRLHQQFPSLQAIANLANMSISTLKRKFYLHEGRTLEQFFFEQKMELALEQLRQQVPLKDIALSLGYANQANFSNAFKRKYGTAPLHFLLELTA